MILINNKQLTILAAFVSALTIVFCFWMVKIHQTAVASEATLAAAALAEAQAKAEEEATAEANVVTPEVNQTDPNDMSTADPQNTLPSTVKMTDMVRLTDYLEVKVDPFYNSDNFLLTENEKVVKKPIPIPEVLVKAGTLQKLKQADALLKTQGYNLIIYCAYRDENTQVLLRQHYENLTGDVDNGYNYVARPGKSKHQSGQAVDLTIESFVGERQDPTPYLEFSEMVKPENHPDNAFLKILQKAMVDSGFEIYNGEWWHFNDNAIYN